VPLFLFAKTGRAYNSSTSALASGGINWSRWGLRFCDVKTRGSLRRQARTDFTWQKTRDPASYHRRGCGICSGNHCPLRQGSTLECVWRLEAGVSGIQSCRLYFCSLCFIAQSYCDWWGCPLRIRPGLSVRRWRRFLKYREAIARCRSAG